MEIVAGKFAARRNENKTNIERVTDSFRLPPRPKLTYSRLSISGPFLNGRWLISGMLSVRSDPLHRQNAQLYCKRQLYACMFPFSAYRISAVNTLPENFGIKFLHRKKSFVLQYMKSIRILEMTTTVL
jgi:hypothetical protein